jgi:hypothetical protein
MKAMDDSMLEREIEGLLSVDAAPDFRARVRQRLAQEPPLRASRPPWDLVWHLMPAAGACAAIAAVIVLRVGSPSPQAPGLEARPIGQFIYGTLAPSVAAPSVARIVVRAAAAAPRRAGAVVPLLQMEMVIHAPEAAAWRRLLGTIHSGAIDLSSSLTRAADHSTSLPASDEFVLPRIVIEPLAPELSEQGVRP